MDGKIINRKLLSKALKLENHEMLVDFAWEKKILAEEVPLNVLVMKECDNIQIPVSLQKIENLKVISDKLSTPVMAKAKSSNLPDDVSQRWEVNAPHICSTTFKGFSLMSAALHYLPLPTELTHVQAQFQKLILIDNGGFIHSSSECLVDGKIGTLILQLPVEGGHQGGNLNVEYKGRKKIFENHSTSDENFYLSAFYSCCEYFTESVTKGFKLSLVFDLIWTDTKTSIPLELPVFFTALKQVKEVLKPWTQQMHYQDETVKNYVICTKIKKEVIFENCDAKFQVRQQNQVAYVDSYQSDLNVSFHSELPCKITRRFNKETDFFSEKNLKENVLFFVLHEKYDMNDFAFEFLRGQDRKTAELLQNCVSLDLHLAIAAAIPFKIKTEDFFDLPKLTKQENQEGVEISWLIDSENVTRNMSIALDWRTHFVGVLVPDLEENDGNEDFGDEIEFAKKHLGNGVLVIWPKQQSVKMYCRYGLSSFLTSIEASLSLPKWQEEARRGATSNLRQIISFCYAEPQRAWTTSGLGKGELTLRLFRFCISLRAREVGLDLLKLLGSSFESCGIVDNDMDNFEGIQNEEVAEVIADFVNQVTGWRDMAELIERLLSRDRITKQLLAIVKLAKCFLRTNCVQGAKMVGDSVSSFFAEFDQTRASKSKEFEVKAYADMIVDLETNPDTCCRSRTASFVLFFSKVRSSLQCRVLLYFETQFNSQMKNHQSCKDMFYALFRKILSISCNIYVPPVKSIIVDLVCCFIRLGNVEFLQSLISKISRVPDKFPEGFYLKNQVLVEKIISSPIIWKSATSSELGRSVMASLVGHHLTLVADQLSVFEEDGNEDHISHPDNIKNFPDLEVVFQNKPLPCSLSSCIWFLMDMQENNDDEDSQCLPVRIRIEWKTSLILSKLSVQQLMQLLIDVLKETEYSNKHLYSFGTHRTCQLFFARIKDQVTVMPRRETILELLNLFIQTGDETLTQSFLEHTCESEKSGTWSHHQKHKLFEMLVSSSEVWFKLGFDLKLLVLKTCVDLAIVCNDTSNNTSTLHDCVQLLFAAEKNQLSDAPSTTAHIFLQFLTKISTPQLMDLLLDLQLSEKKKPNITNFPACIDRYLNAYRFFFKQDFVSFVKSTDGSVLKILNCLLWLNDDVSWKNFECQLCRSFPSEEGNLFLLFLVSSETLRQDFLQAPFALKAFRRILDYWIKHSNPQIELPFTWRQPHALLPDHPRVEIFLRSSRECMTYANFSDFSEARVFGEGLEINGPANGFNIRAFPGGEGKYAYCEIVKNICHPGFFLKVIEARQSELDRMIQLRQDLSLGLFNTTKEDVQETRTALPPVVSSEETQVCPSSGLYVENLNSFNAISKEETAAVFTTDDLAVITAALDVASNINIHSTFGLDDLTDLMPPIQENMQAYLAPLYEFSSPHFQVAGSSELDTATGDLSSTANASETVCSAPSETLATNELDNLNTASHACASSTSTLSSAPMSTRSEDKTSNDDGRRESTGTWAADSRRVEEQMTVAPLQPTDDWVACADAWASGGKQATTTSRAKTLPCQSSWDVPSQIPTSTTQNAPPASRNSWKIPQTIKSRANQDLTPKANGGIVKGRLNLDGNKPGDWASSNNNRNPCVSGANAFPICDRRKTTVNADPRICRKCNLKGHSFLKCPNVPIGGKSAEKIPIVLNSSPLAGINLAVNEDWSFQNSMPQRETSRSNRREIVDVCSVKRGIQTPHPTGLKPKENWGASADAMDSPSSPGAPSTSGTSGVMRAGLNNCSLQQKVIGNIAVPKRAVEVKMKWNLQEIQRTGKKVPLPSRGPICEMEPEKSYAQVPEIRELGGMSVMDNYTHYHAAPALTDIRRKNSDVQLVSNSCDFPQSLRSSIYPPSSSAEVCPVVWKGAIDGAEMGKFNVQALNIRTSTNLFGVSLPSSLTVVGRIRPERVWDYINQIRRAATQDVIILKFIPDCDSDRKHYSSFLCQLQQRDRFAVVGPVSKHIRDFYLISLPEGSAIPSALASLTSATKLLDRNRKSSLLLGIAIRHRVNVETGSGVVAVPPEMAETSIKIIPSKPQSSSIRNIDVIPRSKSPPADWITIPNSQVIFSSNLDIDMRTAPPAAITPDVLKNLDIGDLQKIFKTVQNKDDNSCLRKRRYCDVVTDDEMISPKVVKVATARGAEVVPSKVTTLPVKFTSPSSVSSSSTGSIYICTSLSNSSTSDSIAKNTKAGSQSANVALYISPGLPMEPIPAPIDEDLLKKQEDLMEELNSALPSWLRKTSGPQQFK